MYVLVPVADVSYKTRLKGEKIVSYKNTKIADMYLNISLLVLNLELYRLKVPNIEPVSFKYVYCI